MNGTVAFFEIPAKDYDRAVKFYESLLGIELQSTDFGKEKMAFFPKFNGKCPGAISWTSEIDFQPSSQGVLLSLNCANITDCITTIEESGGGVVIPKTKIEAEDRGYFCVFIDSEGNRMGLYSDN